MVASDYIIYVDESGDHALDPINPDFPVFCLTFCVLRKDLYASEVVPKFLELKFRWFGHDMIVLHESDIRKRNAPFVFLGDPEKRQRFMDDVTRLVSDAPMTVLAAIVIKSRLVARNERSINPYSLALHRGLRQARAFLVAHGQADKVTHIVAEARSPRRLSPYVGKEDQELLAEFSALREGRHQLGHGMPLPGFDLIFADKKANSTGLQLADLLARPIALKSLRPDQPNRAFDVIRSKLIREEIP